MTMPATPDTATEENRRRRLIFRAQHRGTYENDLLLGGFVKTHLPGMTEPDLATLEAILDLPDPELADWLTGRRPIPPGPYAPMLQRIRAAALAR